MTKAAIWCYIPLLYKFNMNNLLLASALATGCAGGDNFVDIENIPELQAARHDRSDLAPTSAVSHLQFLRHDAEAICRSSQADVEEELKIVGFKMKNVIHENGCSANVELNCSGRTLESTIEADCSTK